MRGIGAFARLFWRPASLWVLFPGFWAVVAPLLGLAARGHTPLSLWRRDPAAVPTAWQILVVVAVVGGVASALARLDLQRTPFSWTLPGRDGLLLRGTAATGALLAAVLAAFVGHVAGVGAMAPAFAVALFAFAAAGAVVDAGAPKRLRWAAAGAIAWPALRPGGFQATIMTAPEVAAVAGLAAAAGLFAFLFSTDRGRRRHVLGPAEGAEAARRHWSRRAAAGATWNGSLATDALLPWLRAMAHESGGGRRGGVALLYLINGGLAALFGHLAGEPGMIVILAGVTLSGERLQLASGLGHPLSRTRRAELAATGALVGALAFGAAAVLGVVALRTLRLQAIAWLASEPAGMSWVAAIGVAVALAPVAQWAALRRPRVDWMGGKPAGGALVRVMVHMTGFIVIGHIAARLLRDLGTTDMLLAIAALAAVVQIGFRLLLRRHYARADLLPPRPGAAPGVWTT